jgi:hypothetical protein
MGSLNARRQVIEEMLLPEVGIFPHECSSQLFSDPKPARRSAGRPGRSGRFTIDVFALISRLGRIAFMPTGQLLSL